MDPLHRAWRFTGAGCRALVAVPVATFLGVATPGAQYCVALPIPNASALLGAALTAQGAVWDPPRSPFGSFTLTEGLQVVIGD